MHQQGKLFKVSSDKWSFCSWITWCTTTYMTSILITRLAIWFSTAEAPHMLALSLSLVISQQFFIFFRTNPTELTQCQFSDFALKNLTHQLFYSVLSIHPPTRQFRRKRVDSFVNIKYSLKLQASDCATFDALFGSEAGINWVRRVASTTLLRLACLRCCCYCTIVRSSSMASCQLSTPICINTTNARSQSLRRPFLVVKLRLALWSNLRASRTIRECKFSCSLSTPQ